MENKFWYASELHCHTIHSDGDFTVADLIATAKQRCLDGICLTDHNTISGHEEAKDETLAILKGIEWTTYYGHVKVLGVSSYIDWRDLTPDTIDEKMKEVKAAGGLVGIAHPFQLGTPICTGGHWDYNVKDFSLVNYLEIWSEGCPFMNTANRKAIALWRSLVDKGYKITPTFGRDWHRKTGNAYHGACTYILSEDSKITDKTIKTAIEKGRTVVSVGPLFYFETRDGKTLGDIANEGKTAIKFSVNLARLEKMAPGYCVTPKVIRFVGKGGEEVFSVSADTKETEVTLQKGVAYNAELWGNIDEKEDCLLAFTAPIYTF